MSLETQQALPFRLARLLPTGHYARKNLGYLLAMKERAPCIYETDDDNMPSAHWRIRAEVCQARRVERRPWFNVYRAFTDIPIWPRGFPLNHINDPDTWRFDPDESLQLVSAPIQQGLVDGSPDVDAIWRLVLDRDVRFRVQSSLMLPIGTWCPFNSQNTWWWPEAYPLMYLPCHCSFRMTDIWRSFIAQRCLWELGYRLVFHGPDAVQERNVHNLMRDFEEEVPGYLGNERLTAVLNELELESGRENVSENLKACYTALIEKDFFPAREMHLVKTWLEDIQQL